MWFISLWVNSLYCTRAEDTPIFVKMLKKLIKTVATAIVPKSSGQSKRDNTAITINEMMIPEYLATAV